MSTEQVQKFTQELVVPEGVKARLEKNMFHVEGQLGKTYKNFKKIPVDIKIDGNKITITSQGIRKRDYAITNTARAIIKNLCEGVKVGYTIKMKIVYAHFPITVKADKDKILIDNFQGERSSRVAKVVGNTKVVPKGDDIIITGSVLTDVSQTAANIQLKTKVKGKDHRVFLDGIYIFEEKKGIEK